MTDETTATIPAETPLDAWHRREAAAAAALDAALPRNKAAIFAALDAAGLARAVARFDGSGDSGAIEETAAYAPDGAEHDLPAVAVSHAAVDTWTAETTEMERPLREAVEDLAWALLERAHGGWENEDGAHGEIAFEAGDRSIRLEVRIRFTDSHLHAHTF